MRGRYEGRLLRVLTYVQDNPAGDLSLDRLADEAATWLIQKDWSIEQVAMRCG